MSHKDIEFIKAETRRLEALGVVFGKSEFNSVLEPKRAGRPRVHCTEADRKRAYRKRKSEKVTDISVAQKTGSINL